MSIISRLPVGRDKNFRFISFKYIHSLYQYIFMSAEYYETSRLILRPVAEEDAAFILYLMNTPDWLYYIGDRHVRTEEDARQYIVTKMLPQIASHGYGNYVVIRKEDGIITGTCGLYDREGLDGVDLGFAFLPEFKRLGYGFESGAELVKRAQTDFNIQRLVAITKSDNIPSRKLLEKLGFQDNGLLGLPEFSDDLLLYVLAD